MGCESEFFNLGKDPVITTDGQYFTTDQLAIIQKSQVEVFCGVNASIKNHIEFLKGMYADYPKEWLKVPGGGEWTKFLDHLIRWHSAAIYKNYSVLKLAAPGQRHHDDIYFDHKVEDKRLVLLRLMERLKFSGNNRQQNKVLLHQLTSLEVSDIGCIKSVWSAFVVIHNDEWERDVSPDTKSNWSGFTLQKKHVEAPTFQQVFGKTEFLSKGLKSTFISLSDLREEYGLTYPQKRSKF